VQNLWNLDITPRSKHSDHLERVGPELCEVRGGSVYFRLAAIGFGPALDI
jgi:hypothetical protein